MFISEVTSIKQQHKIVLIHGAGADHRVWEKIQARLYLGNVTSLALDLPGHGKTGGAPLGTISEMALAVAKIAVRDNWRGLCVAGHSMGALVALELAARHALHFDSAVLLGAGLEMPVNPALLEISAKTPNDAAASILKWGFAPSTPPGVKETLKTIMLENTATLGADLKACNDFKTGAELARGLKSPVHIVSGALDKMVPQAGTLALLEKLEFGTETTLPQNGHMLPSEAPVEVAAILSEFLEIRYPSRG